MKRAIIVMLVSVGLIGLLNVGLHYYVAYDTKMRSRGHAVGNVHQDLRNLTTALVVLCELEKKPIVEFQQGEVTLTGRQILVTLKQAESALEKARLNSESVNKQSVCDRWGNDVNMAVRVDEAQFYVRVWSNGRNALNEGGTGDDILEDVTIKRPKQ